MDINQIKATIEELEAGNTTYDNCQKLAYLYIVRDNLTKGRQNSDVSSTTDIFPHYPQYIENKRKYQLNETSVECLHSGMSLLCLEISDFVHKLYQSCNTDEEVNELRNVIRSLNSFLI